LNQILNEILHMCFLLKSWGYLNELESGMCLSKTASVSACVLEVGVGKPSVGQGRGLITAVMMW